MVKKCNNQDIFISGTQKTEGRGRDGGGGKESLRAWAGSGARERSRSPRNGGKGGGEWYGKGSYSYGKGAGKDYYGKGWGGKGASDYGPPDYETLYWMAFMKGKGKGSGKSTATRDGGVKGVRRDTKISTRKGSGKSGKDGKRVRRSEGGREKKEPSGADLDSQLNKYFKGEDAEDVKKGSKKDGKGKENVSEEKLDMELESYMSKAAKDDESKKETEGKDDASKKTAAAKETQAAKEN